MIATERTIQCLPECAQLLATDPLVPREHAVLYTLPQHVQVFAAWQNSGVQPLRHAPGTRLCTFSHWTTYIYEARQKSRVCFKGVSLLASSTRGGRHEACRTHASFVKQASQEHHGPTGVDEVPRELDFALVVSLTLVQGGRTLKPGGKIRKWESISVGNRARYVTAVRYYRSFDTAL